MLTWLRELGETVVSFDRSAIEPGYALRCTVGVAIPLMIGVMLGHPALGVSASIGAFITGFTSLQGIYRTRLGAVLAAALGMAAASFIGALAAGSSPAIVVATALAAYACATLGQIGPIAATVSLNSFVAFLLFSSQPLAPAAALAQSALVFGGGTIQAFLLLLVWPAARLSVERTALADVYDNLAEYAQSIAGGSPILPPITPFATARQVLADPQPFARSAEMARFRRLLEDTEAIRKQLAGIATATADAPAARELAGAVAARLRALASTLAGRAEPPLEPLPQSAALQVAGGSELASRVRDATQAASMLSSGKLPAVYFLSKPRPGPYAEGHVEWFALESLRFAIVLAIAMMIGRHFEADRGYWIPLTAAIVLKPDFQATFVRGAGRIAGTLAGAVIATLAIALLRGHGSLLIAGVLATTATAYLAFNPNYALFTVAITTFVVLVLSLRGLPGTTTVDVRVLDTLAGGALAMVGYLVFPTWARKRTRALLADLIEAQYGLADAILSAYDAPSERSRAAIERARTELWKTRLTVEASVDRTRHEPRRPHTIGAGRALRILAATQRFALASLALETGLDRLSAALPRAALASFNEALRERTTDLAAALRDSRRPDRNDPLPAALRNVEAQLYPARDPGHRYVLDQLRAYVEAAALFERLIA